MGDVIRFPARARLVDRTPAYGELSHRHDGKHWLVDWLSASGDSAAVLGGFKTEAEALLYIDEWTADRITEGRK